MVDQSAQRPGAGKTALVTGSAGFIGFFTAKALLDAGYRVIGFDALTDYYDVTLKRRRQQQLCQHEHFQPVEERLEAPGVLRGLLAEARPDLIVHLAAQAGVRYSIDEPRTYVDSNLVGTFELLEALRARPPGHLMMASSSSVYGANTAMPFAEDDKADWPMSFYGATKKAAEAMTHSYAHLYGIPTTLFRFFTVYGPWGRPDMALYKFTRAILENRPIDVFNHGDMQRDFTYVDDLVRAIAALSTVVPTRPDEDSEDDKAVEARADTRAGMGLSPVAPWRVVNIGSNRPVKLTDFIDALEQAIGKTAIRNLVPMQPGDVPATWADCSLLTRLIDVAPPTPVEEGVRHFVDWYRAYHDL